MHEQDLAGQLLGHYRILHKLASGGTATVYVAMDLHLRRQVAIKVFRLQAEQDGQFPRWFAREAQVLANLDHPHILQVHDYGEQEGFAYLVMPFMTQGSLRDRLQSHQPLPIAEALHLTTQILQALQYAHELGLIHRDIKPGNLLFKTDGTLVLSDFGLAKILSKENEQISLPSIAATVSDVPTYSTLLYREKPYYIAPEQIQGPATVQSDLYSVGIILYEMLTGHCPFGAENTLARYIQHLTEPPRPPCELNPQIPRELEAVVLHALEKDPLRRYQSASDFLRDLRINGEGTKAKNPPSESAPRESMRPSSPARELSNLAPMYQSADPNSRNRTSRTYTPQSSISEPSKQAHHRDPLQRNALPAVLLVLMVVLASTGALVYAYNRLSAPPNPFTSSPGAHKTSVALKPLPRAVALSTLQTSCPTTGTARPAALNVTPSLVQGKQQNLIYQTDMQFKRYDVITGKSTTILSGAAGSIGLAQISANGQWIFFVSQDSTGSKLQLVRLDGLAIQTLYCTPEGIDDLLLSPNEDRLAFDVIVRHGAACATCPFTLYTLDMATGKLYTMLKTVTGQGLIPLLWSRQHSTMLYLTDYNYGVLADRSLGSLYLLDTAAPESPMLLFRATTGCEHYALSPDNTHLFISQCSDGFAENLTTKGPSTIRVATDPTNPSTLDTIYNGPLAISSLDMISGKALLLEVSGTGRDNSEIWKINTDGTGLKQLTASGEINQITSFTQNKKQGSQDTWANVSRDGMFYWVITWNADESNSSLGYASLSGGEPKMITTGSIGEPVGGEPVGWTTM